ncbi:hypothetical protein MKW94_014459 [Papaver nudicaule]|uniref:Uncharacterized protein n=1 Tax=Papaver nudicaule TaxID=74823 RepID=A0AA41S243_PAPNU|nr:hypothetical protein [Papaver nudicaule]
MAATRTPLSLVGYIERLTCFNVADNIPSPRFSCSGRLMRWRYSPTDDVAGDCIGWCESLVDTDGVKCAQMNEDESYKFYCACYDGCVIHY